MTKKELVRVVAEETNLTQKDVKKVLDSVKKNAVEALSRGEKIQITGFGMLTTRKRAERQGKSPRTGETITIPAAIVPVFYSSKKLKEIVNK